MPFRAGDHVFHHGTRETWLLAADEADGEIVCCGWPETYAPASGCTLVKAATDEERLDILRAVARITDQRRGSLARDQLAATLEAMKAAGNGPIGKEVAP